MSSQERFARGFLTLKSSLGAPAAWDFWQRLSDTKSAAVLAKNDPKKVEKVLKTAFSDAWTAAAPNAKTKKAKLASKKTPAQVGTWEAGYTPILRKNGIQLNVCYFPGHKHTS